MRLKRLLAGILSGVCAFSLMACSTTNNNKNGNEATNIPEVKKEQTSEPKNVHLNLAESWAFGYFYTVITPDKTSNGYDSTYYLSNYYDTLVEYDQKGELQGVLAKDWTVSEDGCVYTFHIREGVKFCDGSPLTAEDVAKSLLAVPVNLGQYNGSYGNLSTIIADAVVKDEYTVELHLTKPYYSTLRDLALPNPFGIVSSEQLNDDLTAKDSFQSATYGTGPYMYEGNNDGQVYDFVRNPNYWGEKPEVDSFSIKVIPDNDAKMLALKNGEIDLIAGITKISAESYEEISNLSGYGTARDENALQTFYMGYNLSDSVFGDQIIRESMSSAIDKDAIVSNIFGGMYEKADTFFDIKLPYCDVEQKTYEFNIEKANELLEKAGYIDSDGDGIREKDGKPLKVDFLYQTGSASEDDVVVYLCDQMGKIGIELTPKSAAMMDWYAMITAGQYGVTMFRTQGGYYDPTGVISNIDPNMSMDPIVSQICGYLPEKEKLIADVNISTDQQKIQDIYTTILTTMADQCLITPLYYTHQVLLYKDTIENYEFLGDSNYTTIKNIHLN